nr:hypothetical protein Iba_chr02bCG22160 [Ipomoea batatas]
MEFNIWLLENPGAKPGIEGHAAAMAAAEEIWGLLRLLRRPVASNPDEFMETCGNGSSLPGAGGGDNRRLRLLQQPLHRLSVGVVTQFPSKLKDPGGSETQFLKLLVIVVGLVRLRLRKLLRSSADDESTESDGDHLLRGQRSAA